MRQALFVLLLLAAPAAAQSVTLPKEVAVKAGRLAAVTVEYEGDDVRWTVPDDLDVFREYDPDPKKIRLRLIGYADGRFKLAAVACKDKKLSDFATCTVVVGEAPPPGPGPGPNPPPADPLARALQEAYRGCQEADKAATVKALAALYRQGAEAVAQGKAATLGALFKAMVTAAETLKVKGKLAAVQQVAQGELKAKLPSPASTKLEGDVKARAADTFGRLAAALEGVK